MPPKDKVESEERLLTHIHQETQHDNQSLLNGSWKLLTVWNLRFYWAYRQPKRTNGPSWSVRLPAAPHSVVPAVSQAYRQPTYLSTHRVGYSGSPSTVNENQL